MRVRDLMTLDVSTSTPETSIKEAGQKMVAEGVSGLPVLDADGKLVGIVTEGDFVDREAARSDERVPRFLGYLFGREARLRSAETVEEIMSTSVVTIGPDADHTAAARLMRRHGIKRLPVVDEEDRLIGIISRSDVLTAFAVPDEVIEETVRLDIIRRILWLAPDEVDVTVENGHVTLVGKLPNRTDVRTLEELTTRLDGVVGVTSHLHYEVDDRQGPPSPPPPLSSGPTKR